MGTPLEPVIAGIFMEELKNSLIATLMEDMIPWNR